MRMPRMDSAPTRLREQQQALTRHLRDPERHDPPSGWEDRRLDVYRELVFNNLEALLAANFPVTRTVLGEVEWRALVRDFQREHACATPLFPEIGQELIAYLGGLEPLPRPFLRELAHYEWIELALQIAPVGAPAIDAIPTAADIPAALLDGIPALSPLAWPLAYLWPVHRIDASHQPDVAPLAPTLLLVRRDADGIVRFSELTPLAYRLLQRLEEAPPLSGRQQLEALALEADRDDVDEFVAAATPLLLQLHATGVLPGLKPD